MSITKLYQGDQITANLTKAVCDLIMERGEGLPLPAILGMLEIIKIQIFLDHKE